MAKNQSQPDAPPVLNVFENSMGRVEQTEAEYTLSRTLHELVRASQSITARAEWDAWETLKIHVSLIREGRADVDLADEPELYAAASAVVAWIERRISREGGNAAPG